MRTLTVEDILAGVDFGDVQSAGPMQVVPLLGDDTDVDLAPPRLAVATTAYGTVELRNLDDRPTLVPTSAGWVVKQAAQDHAIASAAFVGPGDSRTIDTAMCIQQTQGGTIAAGEHPMLILPAPLRAPALATRQVQSFNRLWDDIGAFNEAAGVSGGGHLVRFLEHYARELDEFVAEFELVSDQIGAAVLIGGRLAGIERAPSAGYFAAVFAPLVRVCYGSVAVRFAGLPPTRAPLEMNGDSIADLLDALGDADRRERDAVIAVIDDRRDDAVALSESDDRLGVLEVRTAASGSHAGQVVIDDAGELAYASLCAVN